MTQPTWIVLNKHFRFVFAEKCNAPIYPLVEKGKHTHIMHSENLDPTSPRESKTVYSPTLPIGNKGNTRTLCILKHRPQKQQFTSW